MSVYTRKADKKKAQQAKKDNELADFYKRAYKGLAVAPETLEGQVRALEKYLSDLERLYQEYSRKWQDKPDIYKNSLYWIEQEIDMTTMQIVQTRIKILQGLEK